MKKLSKASKHRSREVARAFDQLIVATSDDSFEVLEGKYKALERRLLRSVVKTVSERKELRRRVAERLFTEAFGHDCPWPVFGRTLRRIQRLGYSNVERRYHVASLYAMWCERPREHDPREARRLLDETERHLLRLPHSSRLRQELLEALAEKRRETGLQPHDGVVLPVERDVPPGRAASSLPAESNLEGPGRIHGPTQRGTRLSGKVR